MTHQINVNDEKKYLHKLVKKHISSISNCTHIEYQQTRDTSIEEKLYYNKKIVICRACECKWARFEKNFIKYILRKTKIHTVLYRNILSYIGFNEIKWNEDNYKIVQLLSMRRFWPPPPQYPLILKNILTIPIHPYQHEPKSATCLCIKCKNKYTN